MKIAIANDHSAVELKNIIKEHLESKGYEVLNLGTDSTESCDYPVYGEKVGRAVADGEADLGIAICGTGVGISLAANKVKGIRACVCSEPYTAKLCQFASNDACTKREDVGVVVHSGKLCSIWLAAYAGADAFYLVS